MMTGASPKGRRSAPPKLAQAPLRALTGMARSVFPFSARWRLSRDCCAANHWNWWPARRSRRYALSRTTSAAVLPDLADQHLKEIGVSLGHRLQLLRAIAELTSRERDTPAFICRPS